MSGCHVLYVCFMHSKISLTGIYYKIMHTTHIQINCEYMGNFKIVELIILSSHSSFDVNKL